MNSPPALFVVVQFGGSSAEHYVHSFATERAAARFVGRAKRASYRCVGPMGVELPEVAELATAAKELLSELPDSDSSPRVRHLKEVVARVEREFAGV